MKSVHSRGARLRRIFLLAILLCLLVLVCPRRVTALAQTAPVTHPPHPATEQKPDASAQQPSPEQAEAEAIEEAFSSAQDNPQALIKNLESILTRFPETSQRQKILRTILRQALQANDPEKAATYAEKLLDLDPDDFTMLATLLRLLERRADASSHAAALRYATNFITRAEKANPEHPADVAEEKWRETNALMLATAYLMRGKAYEKAGEVDKAFADYKKSYAAYPTAQVAEELGDLAAKKNEANQAVDYYATAFAFPEKELNLAHREELRRKLGSLYVAEHHSERSLGDLVLTRSDELTRALGSRFTEQRTENAGLRDPFDFVLERPAGGPLHLAEYRGKVVVMDFWATWCGPCRLEGKLLQRAWERFRNEPGAAFLAVNVDENRAGVPAFLKEEQWTIPVAYAQGLDRLLGVRAIPTLMIFDRQGRVMFRQEGLDFTSFVETLERKVREALQQPAPATGSR